MTCPLCSTTDAGCHSAENCEGPAVASDKVVDVPAGAVHRRFECPCEHAATSGLVLEVQQKRVLHSVAGCVGLRMAVGAAMRGSFSLLGLFFALRPCGR